MAIPGANEIKGSGPYYCGLDIGSSASKGVLINDLKEVVASSVRKTGVDFAAVAEQLRQDLLERAGLPATASERDHQPSDDEYIRTVTTGYGRNNVDFADSVVTEITCQAKACAHHFPRQITIVDVGGQDSKVIELDTNGKRRSFAINRKCAAGTGAYLEEMALRLDLELGELNGLAASALADGTRAVKLSSFCTVFAKSELLTHLRDGRQAPEIILGVFDSVVKRIQEMISLPAEGEIVMTGGVAAHNPVIVERLARALGRDVMVPPGPETTAAFGAALVALAAAGRSEAEPR